MSQRARYVLAEYDCGCTWFGRSDECLEYCAKHGNDRRRMHPAAKRDHEEGWDWEVKQRHAETHSNG